MAAQATTLPLVRGRIDTIIDRLTTLHMNSRYPEFAHYKRKLEAISDQLLSISNPPLPAALADQVETVLTSLEAELPRMDQRVRGDRRLFNSSNYRPFIDDWVRYRPELHEYIAFIVRGRLHELRPRPRTRTMPSQSAPPSSMPTLEQAYHPPRSHSHPPPQSHPPPPPSSRQHRAATSVGGHHDPHSTTSRGPMPGPSMYAPAPAQQQQYQPPAPSRSSHSQPPNRHAVPPVIPPPEYFPAPSRHQQQQQYQHPYPVAYNRAPPPPQPPSYTYSRSRTPYPAAPVPTYLAHVYAQSPAMAAERL